MNKVVKVYRNEDVEKVIAFIPRGHMHVRILVEFKDQVIVLQEASIAAILRAYVNICTHPYRKAIELVSKRVPKEARKVGYAEYQLLETSRSEKEILDEVERIINMNKNTSMV